MLRNGANSMAMSIVWVSFRKVMVGTGTSISLLCTNGLRKQSCHLVGPPFSTTEGFSQPCCMVSWSTVLCLLTNRCGLSHEYAQNSCKGTLNLCRVLLDRSGNIGCLRDPYKLEVTSKE